MQQILRKYRKEVMAAALILSFSVFAAYYYHDIFFKQFVQSGIPLLGRISAMLAAVCSFCGIGWFVLFRRRKDLIFFHLLTALLIGSVIVSQILFLLGIAGFLPPLVFRLIFIAGLTAFIFCLFRHYRSLQGSLQNLLHSLNSLDRLSLFFFGLILLSLLITFIAAFYPPYFSDEISYHLLNPKRFLQDRAISGDMENPYSLFPVSFEMLYMYCMSLFGDRVPKFLHWFFHILSLALIYRIARKEFSAKTALSAATLFSLTPVIAFYSTTAFITSGIITFFLASFYFLLNYLEKRYSRDLLLSLCFSAFLLIMHHSSPMLLIALFLVYLWGVMTKRIPLFPGAKTGLLCLLLLLIIASPYYIRNVVVTGNPFYPVFSSALHVKDWNSFVDYAIIKQFHATKGEGRGILSLIMLPVHITFHFRSFSTLDHEMGIGLLYLMLLPVFLAYGRRKDSLVLSAISISLCFSLFFWFFFMPHFGRFLFPVMALFCIPLGLGLTKLRDSNNFRLLKNGLFSALIIAMLLNIITILQTLHSPYLSLVVTGHFNDEAFLKDIKGPEYLSAWFLDRHIKDENARIAFVKNFTSYYCRLKSYSFYISPTLSQAFMTQSKIDEISQKGYQGQPLYNCRELTEDEVLQNIRNKGIRFIALSKQEREHLNNIYITHILDHARLIMKFEDYFLYELQ